MLEAFHLALLLRDVAAVLGLGLHGGEKAAGGRLTEHFVNPSGDFGDACFGPLEPLSMAVVRQGLVEACFLSLLAREDLPALIGDQASAAADRRQPGIGIIDAQVQTELGARGEHTIGLVGSFGDEVIDENAGIAFGAADDHFRPFAQAAGGVHAGDEALTAGLLVAGSAVDLAGEVEAGNGFDLEAVVEFTGVDGVIFDGVTGADHLGVLEAGDGGDHGGLHIDGHAGRHAVQVNLVGIEALGFEENLVTGLIGKLDDLILYRGAVTGADAFDLAAIERGARNRLAQDAASLLGGVADVALNLKTVDSFGKK